MAAWIRQISFVNKSVLSFFLNKATEDASNALLIRAFQRNIEVLSKCLGGL